MPTVHILPENVISKIAAGEVIERPASAVKELIENSLDANSDTIEVHLKDSGKTLIRVKDNGKGIDEEDLQKIFQRHATSKIETADDLFDIHSLGFRGEALYSIASIADVTLRSQTRNADSGWEIHLRGGERIDLKPCAFAGTGTEIEIKELFYNTPARRKFLKSNTTEIHQVLNTFIPYTLLFHKTRFLLMHQDKALLDLTPSDNLIGRIAQALNLDEKHLMEVSQPLPVENCSIRMVLGDINIKRPRRNLQFIFVNNRPVQNKAISFHLNQIYRLILPDDCFGFFAVFLNIPADEVDVNIHPTKREVKIKDERGLCTILRSLCEQTLMQKGPALTASMMTTQSVADSPSPEIDRALSQAQPFEKSSETLELETTEEISSSPKESFPGSFRASTREKNEDGLQGFYIPPDSLFAKKQNTLHERLAQSYYVGSFHNKYLLFESGKFLMVIDQHAAQERVTYEHLITQMQKGTLEVQPFLSPILIKLSPQEFLIWEQVQQTLEELGFSTTQMDKETIGLHSHPNLIKNPEHAVRQLLAGDTIATSDPESLARRACRASVMAGDPLNAQQAQYLREQLLQCLDPFTCPHGRPTVIELSEEFIDKQFLRT